jgi:hypothetical protein
MAKTLPTLLPPAHVVEVARCTMGAIDLDPYSNAEINHVVQASRYLERDEDMAIATGRHWSPGGSKRALLAVPNGLRRGRALANKLLCEYRAGSINEAIFWSGSNEILASCPWLWDFPICLPFRRLAPRFWDDELEQTARVLPADWSAIVYLPPPSPSGAFREGLARFHAAASPYGRVVLDEWSGESRWQESYQVSVGKPYAFGETASTEES